MERSIHSSFISHLNDRTILQNLVNKNAGDELRLAIFCGTTTIVITIIQAEVSYFVFVSSGLSTMEWRFSGKHPRGREWCETAPAAK